MRKGNIMARARMIVAYDQSEAFKGLVVGTGNKTEILLGYTTLYGDFACALNPIGDLYKTQVRQLARALKFPKPSSPNPLPPTCGPARPTKANSALPTRNVDKLLYLLVDQRYRPEECVEAGFAEKFVRKVVERVRSNQFKRILPPIAKLSSRTVGYDFLYLRDWGT